MINWIQADLLASYILILTLPIKGQWWPSPGLFKADSTKFYYCAKLVNKTKQGSISCKLISVLC
jgi:hypothetical protein